MRVENDRQNGDRDRDGAREQVVGGCHTRLDQHERLEQHMENDHRRRCREHDRAGLRLAPGGYFPAGTP
jgi:hypothetical protein